MQIHELNSFTGTPGADDYLVIDDGTETSKLAATGLLDLFYPVGSYYETSDTSFNPNNTWGGAWVLETAGMVHVSAGTDYAISGANQNNGVGAKDGGETTHLLTSAESGQKALSISGGGHTHAVTFYYRNTATYSSGSSARPFSADGSSSTTNWASIADNTGTHTHSVTASNATSAHNNMQPYINVRRWHRTA